MAKPKLKTAVMEAAAAKWVKTGKARGRPTEEERKQLTVYLPPEIHRMLWDRRVETGIPLARSIEDAVVKVYGKPKRKID